MRKRWIALGVPLALALSIVLTPWRSTPAVAQTGPMAGGLAQLSGDAFDRLFLMEMSMHHAMAVMMSGPVVQNGAHQETKDLANGIISSQTAEIAQMRAWARDWYGLDIPDMLAMMAPMMSGQPGSAPGMPHMGHGPMGGQMPMGQMPMGGMMSGMSMMGDLWTLPPNRLDAVFLSLMIPHHQGALQMAALVPERAAHQELKDLAVQITASQSGEIEQMNAWLAAWYGL